MKSESRNRRGPPFLVEHKRFAASDRDLLALIIQAYGIRGCRPLGEGDCALVAGGPEWLKKDRFDIQAKMPDGSPDYTMSQFLSGQAPQLQSMLQALLADRFHLKTHRESRQLPVYALTVGKRGHKLKKAEDAEEPALAFRPLDQPDGVKAVRLTGRNKSMRDLAEMYTMFLDRPVLDRTGLAGNFDFTVEYETDPEAGPLAALGGPALFRAFQEQAGLKFEATRGAVEILVIDHAERPTEN